MGSQKIAIVGTGANGASMGARGLISSQAHRVSFPRPRFVGPERALGAAIEVTSNMFQPGVAVRRTPPSGS
jgi:hypothetical protein